jgi:hypothetical protein
MQANTLHREIDAIKRANPLESLILTIRGGNVLIDADRAATCRTFPRR